MSYDISYHPVDGKFIRDRVVPYVRGTGSLDDVLPDMVRLERVRHRAAAWARKVSDLSMTEWTRQREAEESPRRKNTSPVVPDSFSDDLHVCGRPFFITAETPEEVSEIIDRYCAADSDDAVDALVREELARLNPALPQRIKPPRGKVPPDDQIARNLLANLDEARTMVELAERGEPFVDNEGEERDAREAFAYNFPLAAVAFAAVLRPGWRAGGRVWPTFMIRESGLSSADYFEKPTPLFTPLLRSNPQLEAALRTTIVLNYELGGYVRPNRVNALRRFLRESHDHIVAQLDYGTEDLRKIDEALYDAGRRKLGFVEGAEVYNILVDIMN